MSNEVSVRFSRTFKVEEEVGEFEEDDDDSRDLLKTVGTGEPPRHLQYGEQTGQQEEPPGGNLSL